MPNTRVYVLKQISVDMGTTFARVWLETLTNNMNMFVFAIFPPDQWCGREKSLVENEQLFECKQGYMYQTFFENNDDTAFCKCQ